MHQPFHDYHARYARASVTVTIDRTPKPNVRPLPAKNTQSVLTYTRIELHPSTMLICVGSSMRNWLNVASMRCIKTSSGGLVIRGFKCWQSTMRDKIACPRRPSPQGAPTIPPAGFHRCRPLQRQKNMPWLPPESIQNGLSSGERAFRHKRAAPWVIGRLNAGLGAKPISPRGVLFPGAPLIN